MMEDEEICLALGVDPTGKCLRHPNVAVVTGDGSENYVAFQACKICRSELAAGGLKLQRKSMAYSIQAVQELHQDKRRWDDFKQNWKDNNTEDSEVAIEKCHAENIGAVTAETPDDNDFDGEMPDLKNGEKGDTSTEGAVLPQNLNDIVRDALLRGAQVQRWLLVEKTKEIENLKKELQSATMENETLKKQMEDQKVSFEEKIKKQEKTINQELKMIKSIASQRAVSRATKSSHSSDGELGMHQSHSSFMQSSTASLSISASSQEAPPQLPIRQASEKCSTVEKSPTIVEKKLSITSGPKDPPKLPIRQTSDQLMKTASKEDAEVTKVSPRSVQRKISESSNPPSCPQRQDSEEAHFDAPIDQNSESQGSADTRTNGILNAMQSNLNNVDAANPTTTGSIPSIKEGETHNDDNARAPEQNSESAGSQEISFVPTDSERINNRTTSITDATGSLKKESKEIKFDAKHQGSNDLLRKISASKAFDAKKQLLLEASQALSGNATTPSQRRRKTASSSRDSTDGSSETPKEIKFGRSGITPSDRILPGDAIIESEKEKSDEQILQEKIFGNAAVASEEDEENDEYDYFGLPSELPVNSDRYLDCNRDTMNLSPVSALTNASYMFDAGQGMDAEESVVEPKKGLNNAVSAKRLPMEQDFDSDDETKPEKPEETHIVIPKKTPPSSSAFHRPTPKRGSKKVMRVENQVVHDKYGDGGMYSGYVSTKDRLPHGKGKMIYENGRQYEGDWKGGRWHGEL